MDSWDGSPDPHFDAGYAEGFIGKYLLVGITNLSNQGQFLSQMQMHGVIVAITAEGIDIELRGVNEGKNWRIPPCLNELVQAEPGIYKLKSTNEEVVNPDFTCSLNIHKAAQQ